jgi:hypothetical protein
MSLLQRFEEAKENAARLLSAPSDETDIDGDRDLLKAKKEVQRHNGSVMEGRLGRVQLTPVQGQIEEGAFAGVRAGIAGEPDGARDSKSVFAAGHHGCPLECRIYVRVADSR